MRGNLKLVYVRIIYSLGGGDANMAVISFYLFLFTAITISTISEVNCWDNEDLELFDLVEEINKNFYEVLNVQSVRMLTILRS